MAENEEKSQASPVVKEQKMKRTLSLVNVVALLVSITGHISVFITPGSIVQVSGSIVSTLIIYCIGTFLVYTLALCFTELSTIFQGAGGPYLYLTQTFGNIYGFLFMWGYIILISGPFIAFCTQTTALYIIKAVVPSFNCSNVWYEISILFLAGWLLITLFYLNCFYMKTLLKIQSFLTLCKMIGIFIIIIAGVYKLGTEPAERFENPVEDSVTNPGYLSLALLYVIFSNGGWQAVTSLTEEVKNPAKTLPQAIHLTFMINLILIVLVYLSYFLVLDKLAIIETKAVAILFFQNMCPPLVPVISALVAFTSVGALNTALMGHSRVLYAAARKGDMPSALATLHPIHRTPMVALAVVTLYGAIMEFSGGTTLLMQFIGMFSLIMGLKVVLALLYLRYKKPNLPRPYRVPTVFAIVQVFVNIGLMIFLITEEPKTMLGSIMIYLAGFPVYWICVSWKNKPLVIQHAIYKFTAVIQKLFVQVP